MLERELREKIKSGDVFGCYVLTGEEDYLKRYYLGEISRAVITEPTFETFNHLVYDGQEVSFASIIEAIKAPPMFDKGKVIEWRYPSFVKMKESDLQAFEMALDALDTYGGTALVFTVADGECDVGTEKRPGKFVKRFGERCNIVDFPRSSDSALMGWLKRHFEKEGINVSREALEALIFRSGRSMDVLSGEVIKLSCYLHANKRDILTPKDVELVASSTPECDTYALTNAILDRNRKAAYLALNEMKRERIDPTVIIGMMARTYSELVAVVGMMEEGTGKAEIERATGIHPFRVKSYMTASRLFKKGAPKAILDELSRVDVGAKFGGVSGFCAIEMFISKCL